ncbi:helix-turn-helix transcriptional regulator [Nocardia sp. NPDC049220]|uniref:helix-turn-helix domain-containing protein n=1 Tax=Nocardia sp. NPDC049220 TaxID=3155273 RepID=UPI0033CB3417
MAQTEVVAELRHWLDERGMSQRALAAALMFNAGSLSRIINGRSPFTEDLLRRIDDVLDTGGALLRAANRATFADETVTAARDSMRFASWAATDQVDALAVDSLTYELARIATAYVSEPPAPLFRDLVMMRDQTWRLLEGGPHPNQARELFYLGGVTLILMAHATQNLGNSMAAMQQARAAEALAVQADHGPLRGWVAGTQALIAEWSGQAGRAVDFAAAGMPHAPAGDHRVRLAALHARCAARAGQSATARSALTLALEASENAAPSSDLAAFGGILEFPATKATYYAGSTLVLLGDFAEAERMSTAAITAYESGPPQVRSYGDEALARVDVALARLGRTGDIDGAAEALAPVLALPVPQRIRQIGDGLARVQHTLTGPKLAAARPAAELTQQIRAFASTTLDHSRKGA